MIQTIRKSRLGFTLVELAIVLAIAGLLFAGLWRLLSGGNQQLRDQAAASSQAQLISAVKGYLASSEGISFMTAMAANGTATLPEPTLGHEAGTASCSTTAPMSGTVNPGAPGLCNFLPTGFYNGTTNSYGQTYLIKVLKDGTAALSPPNSYSFMIMTTGGDVIPDTSGGRLTSMIGGDGGFIYNSNVCSASLNTKWACGAYGAWTADITTYGFAAPGTGGYVATRTFYTPEQSSTSWWLARKQIDTNFVNNTMQTGLYMGSAAGTAPYSNINMAPPTITSSGGVLNMQGGSIYMTNNAAPVVGTAINLEGTTINMQGGLIKDTSGLEQISLTTNGVALTSGNALMNIGTGCSQDSGIGLFGGVATSNCTPGFQDTGDANVVGRLTANSFYATTFIYGSVVTPSDMRLKSDILPLQHALDDVERLKPVSFDMKDSGRHSLGFLAQDLEKVYPSLVIDRPDGYKGVNYDGLIAPLIGAVQELKKENDDLRQQIQLQRTRLDKLESKTN